MSRTMVNHGFIIHQSGLPLSGRFRTWMLSKGWNPVVNLRDVVTIFARPNFEGMAETGTL
ncbi:MAG: hypothetical protein ACR2HX_17470 [Pyrinomonadaceae bacterium]